MRSLHAVPCFLAINLLASSLAAEPAKQELEVALPAQSLAVSLDALARLSGRDILYPSSAVSTVRARPVHGRMTPEQALARLLEGTGLQGSIDATSIVVRTPDGREPDGEDRTIVVTGSRIRGAPATSPVFTVTQQDLRRSGRTSLAQLGETLPQNFGGGQNPGVLAGTGGNFANQNLSSSASLNLRGLGPDATLTLLNGRRLAYDGNLQATDISAIPLAAVNRIEVVADGASALYGSDAVAGVVNILLKRDYSGLTTSARLAASTDGGNRQQQYSATTGTRWASGGFLATYDYSRSGLLRARDRSYTRTVDGSTALLPLISQHSALLSGHQTVMPSVEFSLDASLTHRDSSYGTATTTLADYRQTGIFRHPQTTSFQVSPKVDVALAPDWTLALLGSYGQSQTRYRSTIFAGGVAATILPGRYTNRLRTVEANIEGAPVTLPGGAVRLAVGGGWRSVGLTSFSETVRGAVRTITTDFTRNRTSQFAFGEAFVPVVGADNAIDGVHRLALTGALRYEKYNDLGSVVTPKLGAIYSPIAPVDLKLSWGRSFKTPTLYNQYIGYSALLFPAATFGGAGGVPTALYLSGGNPALQPERARTITFSTVVRPAAGLKLEAGYSRIVYRKRITQAIGTFSGVLTNPAFASALRLFPSSSDLAVAIAGSTGLQNLAGVSFDPAGVVAILDGRFLNVAGQTIDAFDVAARYALTIGNSQLELSASASRLTTRQKLTPEAPSLPLAGTLFYPPHWRARGGAVLVLGPVSGSTYLNYVGPVTDNRALVTTHVRGMTTVDLAMNADAGGRTGLLRGVSVSLAMFNLLNQKPARIAVASPIYPAYDSTNYSAAGRVVSVQLTKSW